MSEIALEFDHVWKKFKKGESFDSLRDLIPAVARRLFSRKPPEELQAREFWAVHDVSFEVKRGEALGIIGPNGAGKSTILKLLSKILRPNKGQIRVHGRLSALIEIGAGFHPDLTGRENVFLNGAILGMTRDEIRGKFDQIVEFSGLEEFIDTPVKRYSSGMYARLGFSVAAHVDPEILLVDEVLSVGDMNFQQRCMEKMKQRLEAGVAVIFVSHNLQAVATLCHRAIVIGRGKMVFDGVPGQAIDAYLSASRTSSSRYGAAQDKFRLVSATFTKATGGAAHVVAPHEACELEVALECLEDSPQFNIGLEIERTRDLLYCYGATTRDLGHAPLTARRGEVIKLRYRLIAHFARGHYRMNLNMSLAQGLGFLFYAESVATFSVEEMVSYNGVVDVELQAEIEEGSVEVRSIGSQKSDA
jgi:lipopolysaccharide transport system ATP-binding protein